MTTMLIDNNAIVHFSTAFKVEIANIAGRVINMVMKRVPEMCGLDVFIK